MTSFPVGPAPHGLWVSERLAPLGAVNHLPFAVRFEGDPDLPALTSAVADLTARHPALSLTVREEDGIPVFAPGPRPGLAIRACAPDLLAGELLAASAAPFDPAAGPLVRFTLFTTGQGRATLHGVAHHLVFDGASTDVLLADLAAAYAHRAGHGPAPEPLPAPDGAPTGPGPAAVAAAVAHWADRPMPGPAVALPGLAPGADQSGTGPGAVTGFELDPALRDGLTRTAGELGVTVFELVLAAVHTLLTRYGNEHPATAVGLGTRSPGDVHRIGMYANELPVVTSPDPAAPFDAFARTVRTALRDCYPHRAVPLARAVPGLPPGVTAAPVTVTYRRRTGPVAFPGLGTSVDWVLFPGTARGALRIHLLDGPDRLEVRLMHRTEVLSPASAERIGDHLRALLAAVVAAPGTPLAELSFLGAAESEPLRGPEPAADAAGAALPALLAAAFAAHHDRPALTDGERTIGYGELGAAVTRLARRLTAAGVGPGTVVAVCAERSAEAVAALLAVGLAGGAYLPVDPAYPAERVAFVLADAGAPVVLAQRRTEDRVAGPGRILLLDDVFAEPTGSGTTASAEPVFPVAGPDDLAYLIYTSGSTGRPKGVEVPHGALAHLLLAFRDLLGSGPADVWLAVTSLSFDISALELLLPLVTGGRVVIAAEPETRDGRALTALAERYGVTHLQATPSGWRLLLDAGFTAPALTALCGGEALPLPLARRLRERVGRLWNVYGPTETTIWSTAAEVPADAGRVTVGRPIAGTTALVLDPGGRPVPHGTTGELALGGAGLARGYRARPELTADRFRVDPRTGDRYYRTGDLARVGPGGVLECLGRIDDQVKLRGHRIELGEIEARALEHPAVAAAAAAVRGDADAPGGQSLALYPVWRAGVPEPSPAELRAFLALTLPEVMVPGAVRPLAGLPLTPNGKTDRRALPEPVRDDVPDGPPDTPGGEGEPWDELTEEVAGIWCEVMGLPSVGLHDDLFDLGAHSLTITQVAARIRDRMGADVPLTVFYDDPTVAAVADAVTVELLAGEV
ncbi:amino acid adenylation domain-containing protein [Streptomyces sp. NPDC020875]|uniref:non-ribosomal peptide synthetase n=1 Tax=Streptomyces sp. NPDC020875 TaxID=3154898 RepID=UPI0033EBF054